MLEHTTPRIHELTATAGGKNPSLTPNATQQTVTFMCQSLPTGSKGKFWYYCTAALVKVLFSFTQSGGTGVVVQMEQLWKVMASFAWTSPLLGEVYAHRNTTGAFLGNVINPFARGYQPFPSRAQIPAANATTSNVLLHYRLPLAHRILTKPHETAPWTGFLEGGQIECRLDVNTVLAAESPGSTVATAVTFRCALELLPSPEPVVHLPAVWRLLQTPGGTTRHLLPDLGQPDGLQGIDTTKGVGIAAMLYLSNDVNFGLGGAGTAANILNYDLPFRDQARIDFPDAAIDWFLAVQGRGFGQRSGIGAAVPGADASGWPYLTTTDALSAVTTGNLNDAKLAFFPLVAPGPKLETSKVQTVRGPQEINVGYTATPSGAAKWGIWQLMQYTPAFEKALADLLLGQDSSKVGAIIAPKTVNKNDPSTIHKGNRKLAYTRKKIYLPG